VNALEELTLQDEEGSEVSVAALWAKQPVAFVFLRHYG